MERGDRWECEKGAATLLAGTANGSGNVSMELTIAPAGGMTGVAGQAADIDLTTTVQEGTVYEFSPPGVLVRITGEAPVQAQIYERQKLRCN